MSASESHIRALVEALEQRDQRIAALQQQVTDVRTIGGRKCVIIGDCVLAYDEEANQTGGVCGRIVMDDPIRDMAAAFTDGQVIAHPLQLKHDGQPDFSTAWCGTYCADRNVILRDGVVYVSLDAFVTAHSGVPTDGWRDCFYCDSNGDWVTTARIGCL